jgi:hypothetical protein
MTRKRIYWFKLTKINVMFKVVLLLFIYELVIAIYEFSVGRNSVCLRYFLYCSCPWKP